MKLCKIVFSPTGGTKKVADYVADVLEGEESTVDLSDPELDLGAVRLAQGDVAVIAVPSFGGRVPAVAAERLIKVRGNGARA
ncbi:MAG: 4Fe-4S ferredoxin, partial [Coriobacteriaceae bacterium]|nr:4Fe-4S ferredoxin [Coriobacteriaceae bacterium]